MFLLFSRSFSLFDFKVPPRKRSNTTWYKSPALKPNRLPLVPDPSYLGSQQNRGGTTHALGLLCASLPPSSSSRFFIDAFYCHLRISTPLNAAAWISNNRNKLQRSPTARKHNPGWISAIILRVLFFQFKGPTLGWEMNVQLVYCFCFFPSQEVCVKMRLYVNEPFVMSNGR